MAPRTSKNPRRIGKKVFYVGSPTIVDSHGVLFENIDDAIAKAMRMTEEDGQARPVVQIIKVVERSRPPVVVRNPR